MENTFYKAEKFNEILEKVAGESLFGIEEDGSLNTTVHTGETIEAFTMKVEFPDNSILITTRAFLKAKERNYLFIRIRRNLFYDLPDICHNLHDPVQSIEIVGQIPLKSDPVFVFFRRILFTSAGILRKIIIKMPSEYQMQEV